MRFCIYGNSHVSAFKLAHEDIILKYPGIDIEYWALTQRMLNFCEMSNEGVLAASNVLRVQNKRRWRRVNRESVKINAKKRLDLRGYDVILRVGLDDGRENIRALLAEYSIGGRTVQDKCLSNDFFETVRNSEIAKGIDLDEWDYATTAKRFAMSKPYPAEGVLAVQDSASEYIRTFAGQTANHSLFQRHNYWVNQALNAQGIDYLPQPDETISDQFLSKHSYSIGSRKITDLDEAHDQNDHVHLNKKYGLACFDSLFRQAFPSS